jgi:hypothetical protein
MFMLGASTLLPILELDHAEQVQKDAFGMLSIPNEKGLG